MAKTDTYTSTFVCECVYVYILSNIKIWVMIFFNCLFRKKLQIEVVQPTWSKNQQNAIHRGRGRKAPCSPSHTWKQVGFDLQALPWSNRQRREEPLACHHGEERKRKIQFQAVRWEEKFPIFSRWHGHQCPLLRLPEKERQSRGESQVEERVPELRIRRVPDSERRKRIYFLDIYQTAWFGCETSVQNGLVTTRIRGRLLEPQYVLLHQREIK